MEASNNSVFSKPANKQLKRAYPRYFDSNSEATKSLVLDMKPQASNVITHNVIFPENTREFWQAPDVYLIQRTLAVRRYTTGLFDYIYLNRQTSSQNEVKFQIPTSKIGLLINWMESIKNRVKLNADGKRGLPDHTEVTLYSDITSKDFFKHKDTFNCETFYIRPFLSAYGSLQFRMLEELDEDFHRTIESNTGFFNWCGPSSQISLSVFLGLLKVLKTIKQTLVEKTTQQEENKENQEEIEDLIF